MNTGVRERARETLRVELATAATDVFTAEGFDRVSVEEIAHRLGISRATFFRYFACKEDAVVLALAPFSVDYAEEFAALPDDLPVTESLRRTVQPVVDAVDADSERVLARLRMISRTPSLQSRLGALRRAREDELALRLLPRVGDRVTAAVRASTTLACLDVAWREWSQHGGSGASSFGSIVNRAFAALELKATR